MPDPSCLQFSPVNPDTEHGVVFNIMRYCVHDGPGIRTTVFLKGCPLHCSWCHNPEGQSSEIQFSFREDRCIKCGTCFDACPNDAVEKQGDRYLPLREHCEACGTCIPTCYAEAREQVGTAMSVEDVVVEILKDRSFFEQSGGGVTFSGGEPLLHPVFLLHLLQRCHALHIHTAVETTGFCTEETLRSVIPDVDLFLYDLKLIDNEAHRRFTGVGNERILSNLELLSRSGKNTIVRIPIIPGINDHPPNIQGIIDYLRGRTAVSVVHLLPYHHMGHDKALRLGMETEELGIPSLKEEKLIPILEEFQRGGFSVAIGG